MLFWFLELYWFQKGAIQVGYHWLEIINISVTFSCHGRSEWTHGSGSKGTLHTPSNGRWSQVLTILHTITPFAFNVKKKVESKMNHHNKKRGKNQSISCMIQNFFTLLNGMPPLHHWSYTCKLIPFTAFISRGFVQVLRRCTILMWSRKMNRHGIYSIIWLSCHTHSAF